METNENSLDEVKGQISRLYHDGANVDEAVELMRDQNVNAELIKSIYDQLLTDAEKLMTDRFYYYTFEAGIRGHFDRVTCWTSRYLLVYCNTSIGLSFHIIKIIDMLNDKSTNVTVEASAEQLLDVYPLKDGFGLLKEREGVDTCFISLISLDLNQHTLKKLNTIQYQGDNIKIVINQADPTTFILTLDIDDELITRICKIVEKRIIEDVIEIDFYPECFYGNYAYMIDGVDQDIDMPQICSYNVENNEEAELDLQAPAGYRISEEKLACMRDNLFVWLKDKNNMNVIACLNIQTRQWNILDFYSRLPIRTIIRFDQGNFIVHAETVDSKTHYFYKIPSGNLDSLETIAWLSLVKTMKKREVKDAYETARKYLPLDSTINCPFGQLDEIEIEIEITLD